MQGLNAAYVYSGGAVINSGGNNITIPQQLQAPAGYGVASIAVISGGSGFIDTPIVTITNISASGSGATAVANVSGGVITGITVTCPGQGTILATPWAWPSSAAAAAEPSSTRPCWRRIWVAA